MRSYGTIETKQRSVRDVFFLLAVAVALGLGLALASPALGAPLRGNTAQSAGGSISGSVSVTGGNASGITAELRSRSNGGDEKVLATTTTDAGGNYSFAGQPSVPNDAFYYIKFTGGKGTLAAWYSFPIIYQVGSDFTVPSVEMSDVQLLLPQNATIALPASLTWKARRSGETYRVFVYAQGDTGKAVLDSGSLGMGTEFQLSQGSLQEGDYEAVVQVRDAVVGYGQSQSHFRFTVGKAADNTPDQGQGRGLGTGGSSQQAPQAPNDQQPPQAEVPAAPAAPAAPASPPSDAGSQPQAAAGSADLQLDLSADHTEIEQGGSMVYKIEITNRGSGSAPGVVVTDKLPAGVTVDPSTARSTLGSVAVEDNNVTAQIGDLPSNAKAVVEIPVSVGKDAGSNLSNQATAQYQGAIAPVSSNAYISQVATPLTGSPASPPQSQPASPPQAQPQQPSASQPQAAPQAQPQAPSGNPSGSQPSLPPASQPKSQPKAPPAAQPQAPQKKPASSMPQTGGSFPLVLAMLILLIILVARYLRGRSYRRV